MVNCLCVDRFPAINAIIIICYWIHVLLFCRDGVKFPIGGTARVRVELFSKASQCLDSELL